MSTYQLNYCFQGRQDKSIILFLHGFMGDRNDFNEVIALLVDHFYCLTVDLPGHGNSPILESEKDYTMPKTAQALIRLLQKNQISQCFLVGYSLGGRLALYLIIYFPQYFKKVIIESGSPGLKTAKERSIRVKQDYQLAEKLESSDFSIFLDEWYKNPLFSSLKEHPNFDQMIQKRLNNNPIELAKSLRNMSTGAQNSLWTKLKQNTIPILLLVGELDKKFLSINAQIVKQCPQSQLEIMNDVGHNIHLENTTCYAHIIRHFFV